MYTLEIHHHEAEISYPLGNISNPAVQTRDIKLARKMRTLEGISRLKEVMMRMDQTISKVVLINLDKQKSSSTPNKNKKKKKK